MLFPDAHEVVVKKWIDKEFSNVSVRAKFTKGALEFIQANCGRDSSVLITLSHRYVGSKRGPCWFPCAEIRLDVADPSEDLAKVESNAGMPVLVARELYEVFKQEKIPLIVTTSGLWKFKKLNLKQDLSWLLYSKEEMRRRVKRWSTYE
ncbi:MAG TPA: hypothetical protein VJZ03_02050 [Candidatus Bathyarchaeia archaeon]|nr:hypothetical protein [Candidatus Bathyarchaeia archaeon]